MVLPVKRSGVDKWAADRQRFRGNGPNTVHFFTSMQKRPTNRNPTRVAMKGTARAEGMRPIAAPTINTRAISCPRPMGVNEKSMEMVTAEFPKQPRALITRRSERDISEP